VTGGGRGKLTSLSDGNDVTILNSGGDSVGLHGCGDLVATEFDVLHHDGMKSSCVELEYDQHVTGLDGQE